MRRWWQMLVVVAVIAVAHSHALGSDDRIGQVQARIQKEKRLSASDEAFLKNMMDSGNLSQRTRSVLSLSLAREVAAISKARLFGHLLEASKSQDEVMTGIIVSTVLNNIPIPLPPPDLARESRKLVLRSKMNILSSSEVAFLKRVLSKPEISQRVAAGGLIASKKGLDHSSAKKLRSLLESATKSSKGKEREFWIMVTKISKLRLQ
jgi:hypothetical protein